MSAIVSRGRRGHTVVPNWRWEDAALDPYELRIAGWLASHADGYVEDRVTRNEIARRTGISGEKVSKALEALAGHLELIEIHTEEGGRGRFRITFDFDVWNQDYRSPHDQSTGRHTTSDRSPHDHREEQVEDQSKKDVRSADADPEFVAFWSLYPKKAGRIAAFKAYTKARKSVTDAALREGLLKMVAFWAAENTPVKFIPNPATWLNQGRWEDEPAPAVPESQVGVKVDNEVVVAFQGVESWLWAQRPAAEDFRVSIIKALQTLRAWKYGLGESLIRLACAARYAPSLELLWDPKYLASDDHRVKRFGGMPQDQTYEGETNLVECMQRAYDRQRWGR